MASSCAPAPTAPSRPVTEHPAAPPVVATRAPAPPPDATYSHAGFAVSATLLAGPPPADPDGETSKTLEIRFVPSSGSPVMAALKNGTVSGCAQTQVSIEAVPELRDERLAMLNLFCENGEDSFSRTMVTALVFVGDVGLPPAVLWEGEGSFYSEFDACITIDVPYFRRTKQGAIQAMQEQEVERNEDGDIPPEPECVAEKRRDIVNATIPIPRR